MSSEELGRLTCRHAVVRCCCVFAGRFFPLQVNFTIEPSTCLRDAGFVSRLLAATVVGYDEILVNMFMFSMRSKGLLKNTQVGVRTFQGRMNAIVRGSSSSSSSSSSSRITDTFKVCRLFTYLQPTPSASRKVGAQTRILPRSLWS